MRAVLFVAIPVCLALLAFLLGGRKIPWDPWRGKPSKEEECRRIFAKKFGVPFGTQRPSWLKSPKTGRNLELDGFEPFLKTPIGRGLAFEYDGIQHSEYSPHFHSSKKDFEEQVWRDLFKDKACRERGVLLIRIPHTVPTHSLKSFVEEKLRRKGVLA